MLWRLQQPMQCFNPRPACRANVASHLGAKLMQEFQSAPCVQGECGPVAADLGMSLVSIRALRAGRMLPAVPVAEAELGFNPRPACRANGQAPGLRRPLLGFNPRPACRANADGFPRVKSRLSFNPRPACRANVLRLRAFPPDSLFQSAPCVQGEWA